MGPYRPSLLIAQILLGLGPGALIQLRAVHLAFIDDAKQRPSRPGIQGRMVAAGAISLLADNARRAELALRQTCEDFGFPPAEEFKWSPRRDSWMHANLVKEQRAAFFTRVIRHLAEANAMALVVMEDDGRNPAVGATAEQDVVVLLLERLASRLKKLGETGLVIADRPGGDRREEDRFVAECLAALEAGTTYVTHQELTFVVTADSRFVRLLQAADLATSCLTAYVAGESRYSPPVVQELLPLFPVAFNRRAGYSIKLHPSYNFANLHYWLFGETHYVRFMSGHPMPMKAFDYFEGPEQP